MDKRRFFTFLTRDDAMFLVVEEKEILGYCGLLMVLDEGDITMWQYEKTDREKALVRF